MRKSDQGGIEIRDDKAVFHLWCKRKSDQGGIEITIRIPPSGQVAREKIRPRWD